MHGGKVNEAESTYLHVLVLSGAAALCDLFHPRTRQQEQHMSFKALPAGRWVWPWKCRLCSHGIFFQWKNTLCNTWQRSEACSRISDTSFTFFFCKRILLRFRGTD